MIVSSSKSQHSQDKNLTFISQKKLAGIHLLFWTPPRFAESWFEVHYYDHTIPKDFIFRKQLRMHLITFSRFLLAFPKSIAVHQIP